MTEFDELRFSFQEITAEQKLMSLRSEALQRLIIIHGFASLLHQALEQNKVSETNKPDEYKEWVSKILDYTQSLKVLLDAITSPQYREGVGLPELSPYDNLLDAVHDTAQKSNLLLAEALSDETKIIVHSKYPLVLMDEPKFHREIRFHLANSKYVVTLLSWIDNRMFQEEHVISLSTLDDVAIVINRWLLEQRTLKQMQDAYPVPKSSD
ncbi:MAG: hypothetical protein ABI904_11795 [Chloroflexota bacterium]